MKFSLITVSVPNTDGTFNGYWIQNHVGNLETATAWARHTERTNSNKITVGVVAEVASVVPMLDYHQNLTRLDAGAIDGR